MSYISFAILSRHCEAWSRSFIISQDQ